MLWFIFPPCLHVCLHFLLLFPVSQWKTQRVRPKGVSFGSKLNRTQKGKKEQNRKERKTLAGVQQVWCVHDSGRVSVVLLIADGGFIGAGKKNEAAGRYEVWLLSRSLCEPALRPCSLSLRQQKSESDTAAQSTLPVRGSLPAAYIVQCKWKLDLITALC